MKDFSFLQHPDQETTLFLSTMILKNSEINITKIDIDPSYKRCRDNDFWYRGKVAGISTNQYHFHIVAVGDQRYNLSVVDWMKFNDRYSNVLSPDSMAEYQQKHLNDEPIIEFVNKGMDNNTFLDAFGHLFQTDAEINDLLYSEGDTVFKFSIYNNNWLETFVASVENPETFISINDPFTGYDVGSYVSEEMYFVLENIQDIINYYLTETGSHISNQERD